METYKIYHVEEPNVIKEMTLDEILYEINRDRSELWIPYDESDWREGLFEFTELRIAKEVQNED